MWIMPYPSGTGSISTRLESDHRNRLQARCHVLTSGLSGGGFRWFFRQRVTEVERHQRIEGPAEGDEVVVVGVE